MEERAEKIARVMEIVCDSLVTHLPYTHGEIGEHQKKMGESKQFHKKCVREYAEALKLLSETL